MASIQASHAKLGHASSSKRTCALKAFRPARPCRVSASSSDAPQVAQAPAVDRRSLLQIALATAALLQTPASAQAAAQGATSEVIPEGNVTLLADASTLTAADKQVLTLNKRVQKQNGAPLDFPNFVREGFDIKVIGGAGYQVDDTGIIFKDFEVGVGSTPVDGQEVVFDYTGYNESGAVIDTSYRQGRAAQTRLGIQGLIPGFELGIRGMRAGGKRRIIVPPKLGPPVGPSTFFSAKQCEVFDVELRDIRTCSRRQVMMFSDVVCE